MQELWQCRPTVKLCVASTARGGRLHIHNHPFHELGIVLEGECLWHLEGTVVRVGAREAILVEVEQTHAEEGEGAELVWLGMEFPGLEAPALADWVHRPLKMGEQADEVAALMMKARREVAEPQLGSQERLSLLAQDILLLLCRQKQERYVAPKTEMSLHQIHVVTSGAHFIRENYQHSIRIEEVAQRVGVCPPHFSSLFRRYHRVSPKRYLDQVRLSHARRMLLADQDYTLRDVALAVGFGDAAHLCRRFREQTSMSPRQYQQTQARE